jgi:hypothetical protein
MERDESLFGLQVDAETQKNISIAGRWAKFLAIMGFVFLGFMFVVIAIVAAGGISSDSFEELFDIPTSAFFAIILVAVLIVCLIVGVLCYLLFKGANLTRQGIQQNDQALFNEGIVAYKNYFIVYTIITILGAALNFISLFIN